MPIPISEMKRALRSSGLYEEKLREPNDIYKWLDEAQLEISKYYGNIVEYHIGEVKEWEGHELPDDFLYVSEVINGYDKSRYVFYQISDTEPPKIFFDRKGDYTVHYHRIPDTLPRDNDDAELEVNKIFRDAIISYCLFKYWQREEQQQGRTQRGTPKSQEYLDEFYTKLDGCLQALRFRRRKNRSVRTEGPFGI